MKYIVDIDSLINCTDLLPVCKVNGESYVPLEYIKEMINVFPKDKINDQESKKYYVKPCNNCENNNFDMPQCKECNYSNNFKYFNSNS